MATASPSRGSFDFARGFRFVTEDPDWIKKLLIGGVFTLLAMLLVGAPFVAGYALRLIRNAARGEARPLPAWDDLGGMFGEGLQAVAAYLVYFVAVFLIPGAGILTVVIFSGGLSALGRDNPAAQAAGPFVAVAMIGLYALFGLAMLVLYVYLPAATTQLALTRRLGAAFEVREAVGFIRRNLGNYALAIVLYLVTSLLSQFGVLLCCVGLLPATFWSYCVLAWGMGEVARLDSYSTV